MTVSADLPEKKTRRLLAVPSLKWQNWLLLGIKLAMGLLLILLIMLYFVLRRDEADEQRSTMIADVLWLEQSASQYIKRSTEQLELLASDLAQERRKRSFFRQRMAYLLRNNADILYIAWLDANGHTLISDQRTTTNPPVIQHIPGSGTQGLMLDMAEKMARTVYSNAYKTPQGAQFDVYTPVFEEGVYQGSLMSVYSFDVLLKNLVPWWFAEKYRVRILDNDGETLASKAKTDEVETSESYSISLEYPGYGIVLRADAYPVKGDYAQRLLITLVFLLLVAVIISLWVMRKHVRQRLNAEHALRAEHAFRKAMEDSLMVGMRAQDLDGRITYVNPAFCQMVGFSEVELLDTSPPLPFWPPEEMERIGRLQAEQGQKGIQPDGVETPFMHKNGTRFDVLIYKAPLIDADGRHTGWMSSVVDVTARKRAEELTRQQQEKLQQTSRLVTMGELASSLAHELNQPLAAINSYNTGCLNKLSASEFSREELRSAMEKLGVQARRAGHIIRHIHDFVRKSEPKLAACNLVEVIQSSIGFISADARARSVRIVGKIADTSVDLYADRVMLEQVLLNLMRNAIEAMMAPDILPERRRLTVSLTVEGDQARIRVADRGAGIPAAIRENLFTPFFSTKKEGMGMGLNICRSIIEFHRGRLWVEDSPDGGAIFNISLPLASQ